jgi:hypothetical protein
MNDPIFDSILFLANYRRAPLEATAAFRKMKHNAGILPTLQTQLELVLNAHGRFREVIYDTQGIHDDGVDALVRIPSSDPDGTPQLIGFQVKSFDDMKNAGYLKDLKAQHSDAFRKVQGLVHYFIMLCTDIAEHRERVRSVESEFRSAPNVTIIEPQFAYSLLHHPETRIDAVVKRMIESKDLVFREAFNEVAAFDSPTVRALVVYLAVESVLKRQVEFHQSQLLGDRILEDIYKELRDKQEELLAEYRFNQQQEQIDTDLTEEEEVQEGSDEDDREEDDFDEDEAEEPARILEFHDQIAADLDSVDTGFIQIDSHSLTLQIEPSYLRALTAVITDAVARFKYDRKELMDFAFDVMSVRE